MSIKSNYIFNTANRIVKILVAIVTVPYVSRVLGSSNIGIYSYTYTIASYFALFIMLGLDNYGNREIAKSKKDAKLLSVVFSEIYYMQLAIGIIVFVAFSVFAFTNSGEYATYLEIQCVYLFSVLIDINWALYGLEEFKFTSIRNCIINVIGLVLIIVLVRDTDSLVIYTVLLSALAIFNNVTGWLCLKRRIRLVKCSVRGIVRHVRPNLVLFIPVLAVSIYKMMDKIMMGGMCSIDQVGFYESAEKVIQIPTLLVSSLGTVMLPRMTSLYSDGNEAEANRYIVKSIDAAMIVASSLCFGIMGVSREFVPLFYGDGFELCADLYLILLPCCLFLSFSNVIRTQYLIPKGKDKLFVVSVSSGAIINLISNLILIPKLGAIGAAYGTLIAEASVCIIQSYGIRKELPLSMYVIHAIPFIVLGLVMFIVLYFSVFTGPIILQVILKTALGFGIYAAGLVLILMFGKRLYGIDIMKLRNR